MTDQELMHQALEALEWASDMIPQQKEPVCDCPICKASDALRERMAQHEALDQLIADSQAMGAYSLDQIKTVLRQDDPQFDERMQQARERLAQPYCDDCGGTDRECPLRMVPEQEPWPDEPFGHIAGGVQKPEQPQRTHWEGCEEVHPECKRGD